MPRHANTAPYKCCTDCKRWLPNTAEHFQPRYNARHLLTSVCRECEKSRSAAYRARHREKHNAYQREYARNGPTGKPRARPKQVSTFDRRAYRRMWGQSNRAKLREYDHRRRAREKVGQGFTSADVLRLLDQQENRCFYCAASLAGYEVDHRIPLSRGGTNSPDNIVVACRGCNRSKGAKTAEEFMAVRRNIRKEAA